MSFYLGGIIFPNPRARYLGPYLCWNRSTLRQVFAIWHDVRYRHNVFKNHRKQSGLASWWPVCTKFKMAAIRNREYHISAPLSTIFSCNTTFIYVFWCEKSISEFIFQFWSHLQRENIFDWKSIYLLFCEKKVAFWSEMARNAIESDFRSSKMAAGSHFVKKKEVAHWSEMAINAIESDFRSSKMAAGGHFVKTFKKKIVYWSETSRKWSSVIQNGGGGHHNGQSGHSGIYTVFALGQIHQC